MEPVADVVDAFDTLFAGEPHASRRRQFALRRRARAHHQRSSAARRHARLLAQHRLAVGGHLDHHRRAALFHHQPPAGQAGQAPDREHRVLLRGARGRHRVIAPSGRRDEVGVAEERLAAMERELQGTLRQQRHLAELGLAVSKINHDLRNMLASAQLFSDRLGSLPDPTVQRFAPKLIDALDRAIAYCQSTLTYGRAREPAPARRLVALDRLVDDVADALGLAEKPMIAWENRVPPASRWMPTPISSSACWSTSPQFRSRRWSAVTRCGDPAASNLRGAGRAVGDHPGRGHRAGPARKGQGLALPGLPGFGQPGRHRTWEWPELPPNWCGPAARSRSTMAAPAPPSRSPSPIARAAPAATAGFYRKGGRPAGEARQAAAALAFLWAIQC